MEGKTGHPKNYAKKTPFTSRGICLDVYLNFCHFIIKLITYVQYLFFTSTNQAYWQKLRGKTWQTFLQTLKRLDTFATAVSAEAAKSSTLHVWIIYVHDFGAAFATFQGEMAAWNIVKFPWSIWDSTCDPRKKKRTYFPLYCTGWFIKDPANGLCLIPEIAM